MPEAPTGITHAPFWQTPLAQSGPVLQVVFGSITVGMHSPPAHLPLWQSLGWVQDEPAGEPELAPPELAPLEFAPPELEPPEFEPPLNVKPPMELSPLWADPPDPPAIEP